MIDTEIDSTPVGVTNDPANRILLYRISNRLSHLPGVFYSRGNQLGIDIILSAFAIVIAFLLRFEGTIPLNYRPVLWTWVMILPLMRIGWLVTLGGQTRIWRYFSFHDAIKFSLEILPATICVLLLRLIPATHDILKLPIGVALIDYGVFLFLGSAARGSRRLLFEAGNMLPRQLTRYAIIIGTDSSLATAIRHVSMQAEISIVGLLAPEARLHGSRIGDVLVLDFPSELARFLADGTADLVLVADAKMKCLNEVVETTTEFGTEMRLLPSARDILSGSVQVRAAADPHSVFSRAINSNKPPAKVLEAYRNRTVLVTGAGGSIGSELCVQVYGYGIQKLILVDHDENSIFEVHRKLAALGPLAELVQIVGDIRDRRHMRQIMAQHEPNIILHAAAFKHVPVMELNRAQAVLNNVVGTFNMLDLAVEYGAERFLMISTDKAVHPTSIMGATKRLAEMLVQHRANLADCNTRCACVRFGNVVGSRGSVVPIFLRQIAAGGPITITDKEMTRYFMTVNEAVNLVLQTASLGSRGDIYMLDMGDPVKIADVARRLIRMSGLRPDEDIKIEFVGIRTGEKLHEQLWPADAQVTSTEIAQVHRVHARDISADLYQQIQSLGDVALTGDENSVLNHLYDIPIGFHPAKAAKTASVGI